MTGVGLDSEGYIESCGAVEKISPVFRELLNESLELLRSTFNGRLHGIYLYGSVGTGRAQVGVSDLDLLVVFGESISELDQSTLLEVAKMLSASHEVLVREVGIAAVSLQDALAEETLAGIGCFIQHLCICVAGEDIRPLLPRFRPSAEVARGFNGDYGIEIEAMLKELAETDRDETARGLMRRCSRKTIRTGFSLVMPRLGCWTTELEPACEYFCQCYPEKRRSMSLILDWVRWPPEDRANFLQTMKPLAEWLTGEFGRVIEERSLQ